MKTFTQDVRYAFRMLTKLPDYQIPIIMLPARVFSTGGKMEVTLYRQVGKGRGPALSTSKSGKGCGPAHLTSPYFLRHSLADCVPQANRRTL
jgi:hypothetical protein